MARSSQYALILGEMQRIAFRLMLSTCVCRPRLWTPGKQFEIETSFFFKLRVITQHITCRSLTQIQYKFQDGGQNGRRETL